MRDWMAAAASGTEAFMGGGGKAPVTDFSTPKSDGIATISGKDARVQIEKILKSDRCVEICDKNSTLFADFYDWKRFSTEQQVKAFDTREGLYATFAGLDDFDLKRIAVHDPEFIDLLEATRETLIQERGRLANGGKPYDGLLTPNYLSRKIDSLDHLLKVFTQKRDKNLPTFYNDNMTVLVIVPREG